jgi:GAF domain-containing protein
MVAWLATLAIMQIRPGNYMPASTGKKAPHKSDSLRRTDLLFEAASALLSSPRLDEVLQRILKFAAMAIQADAYAVWRYNKSSDAWGAIASEGLSPAYLQRSTIPSGKAAVFPDRPIVAPGRVPLADAEAAKAGLCERKYQISAGYAAQDSRREGRYDYLLFPFAARVR